MGRAGRDDSVHLVQGVSQYLEFAADVVGQLLQLHFRVQDLYALRIRVVPDPEFFRYGLGEFAAENTRRRVVIIVTAFLV